MSLPAAAAKERQKESVITRRNIRETDIASRVIPQEYYSPKLMGDYPTDLCRIAAEIRG
ncbi:MAG: hypothetical protein QM537_09925 [Candidatus Symbiobacter sp.]|nr:hypothetical protein [Candidatus Symbiobacter sp.]